MEDEPAAPQVRRVLGRSLGLGSPRALIALAIVALLVRLVTLPLPGTGDVDVWKTWAFGASHDVAAMYGIGGHPPVRGIVQWGTRQTTVDYPPVTLYLLGLVGRAYAVIDPAFPDDWRLTALIKTTILLGDACTCFALWLLVRRLSGSTSAALFAAAAYWCNPATLMDGAVLGYLDPWIGAMALAAMATAAGGAPLACGIWIAVAAFTKAQAIFILPPAALLLWMSSEAPRRDLIAAAAAGAGASAALLVPYAAVGALPNLWQGLASLMRHDMLSGTAANLWWIVTWLLRAVYAVKDLGTWGAWTMTVRILGVSRVVALGYPNPRPIGVLLTLAAMGWAFWKALDSGDRCVVVAAGAFAVHAYFTLAVQVHENHLYLAIPLLAAAAALLPRFRPVLVAVSAIFALNLFLFYGIGRGYPLPPRHWTVIDVTVVLAMVNVAVLGWHGRVLLQAANPAAVHRYRDARHV